MKSERRILKNRIRRQQQLKRNIRTVVFFVVLVITLSMGFFTFGARAQDKDEFILYRYYTNIEVQYGETLTDIASAYYCPEKYKDCRDYMDDIMIVNGLYCEDISAGSYLIIPYYSSEFK